MHSMSRFAAIGLLILVPVAFVASPLQSQAVNPLRDPLSVAIELNFSAISLAKLVRNRTKNPRVKTFAEAMVRDRIEALNQLKKEYGFPNYEVVASPSYQAEADKLLPLSGSAFDHEFARQVVADYQVMVNFLEVQSTEFGSTFAKTARDLKPKAIDNLIEAEGLRHSLATGTTVPGKGNL